MLVYLGVNYLRLFRITSSYNGAWARVRTNKACPRSLINLLSRVLGSDLPEGGGRGQGGQGKTWGAVMYTHSPLQPTPNKTVVFRKYFSDIKA